MKARQQIKDNKRKKDVKYVGCNLPLDVYEAVRAKAARESRTLAAEVGVAVKRHVEAVEAGA